MNYSQNNASKDEGLAYLQLFPEEINGNHSKGPFICMTMTYSQNNAIKDEGLAYLQLLPEENNDNHNN